MNASMDIDDEEEVDEKPVVVHGEYTWHPITNLLILLEQLRGSIRPHFSALAAARDSTAQESYNRVQAFRPRIAEMEQRGLSRPQIADELNIGLSTLTKYIRDIRNGKYD